MTEACLVLVRELNEQKVRLELTTAELGRRAGLYPTTVDRALSGSHEPTFRVLEAIAEALGLELVAYCADRTG